MRPAPLLLVRDLHKAYAAPVLRGVDLSIDRGEVHALVGANGAGKSTLGRILCGLAGADRGEMRLAGEPYAPRKRTDAEAAGVSMVMQELNLLPTLSIAENLFLDRLPRRLGFVRRPALERQAAAALAAMGLGGVDPWLAAGRLGMGQQQLVQIAGVLARPALRLVILDEPTAALTDPQIDLLFDRVARLRRDGVSFLYVSHRMEEMRRIADRVTVLRDGALVRTAPADSLSVDDLVQLMSGGGVLEAREHRARAAGEIALEVKGLRAGSAVKSVSLAARRGEILGLAGLVGSGRSETLRAIYGADPVEGGEVRVDGRPARIRHPADAVRAGIGMVPEDRKTQGLLLSQPLRTNVSLARTDAIRNRGGWLSFERERTLARDAASALEIRASSVEQPVVELSGGNQQKVLFARWLLRDAEILLVDEPTRGIDVSAKRRIHRLLVELAERGTALVVVSSDLRELMELTDRMVVLSNGHSVAEFARDAYDEDRILSAAFSGYTAAPRRPTFPDPDPGQPAPMHAGEP